MAVKLDTMHDVQSWLDEELQEKLGDRTVKHFRDRLFSQIDEMLKAQVPITNIVEAVKGQMALFQREHRADWERYEKKQAEVKNSLAWAPATVLLGENNFLDRAAERAARVCTESFCTIQKDFEEFTEKPPETVGEAAALSCAFALRLVVQIADTQVALVTKTLCLDETVMPVLKEAYRKAIPQVVQHGIDTVLSEDLPHATEIVAENLEQSFGVPKKIARQACFDVQSFALGKLAHRAVHHAAPLVQKAATVSADHHFSQYIEGQKEKLQ